MKTILFFQSKSYGIEPKRREYDGILRFAAEKGWGVREVQYGVNVKTVRELLAFWNPVGVVIACGIGRHKFNLNAFGRTPVVMLCGSESLKRRENLCLVSHDNSDTVITGIRELLKLEMASYAYVHHPEIPFWSNDRANTFKKGLSLNGKSACIISPKRDMDTTVGYQKIIADTLAELPKPTGVLAANDRVGTLVLDACLASGLAVPDDVSVVGIDNEESVCEHSHPSLSSISRNYENGGYECGRIISEYLDTGHMPVAAKIIASARFIQRSSTLRLNHADISVISALETIRRQACDGLTASDVANMFKCSRRMAEIKFRKATGKSILNAIQEIRLARAECLLLDSDKDMDTIANMCGYASATSFSNFFTEKMRLPPTEYRKKHKGGQGGI